MEREREVISLKTLEELYLSDIPENEQEDINYYLKYDELYDENNRPVFDTVFEDESAHDTEKNSHWVELVLKRNSDGKFFSWGYQESPWWNADSLSPSELVEVFPKQVMTTIYE